MNNLNQYPEWKQAVLDAVGQFDHGDIIPMEWLRKAFDLYPPARGTAREFQDYQFKFLSYIENFKEDLLINHKRYLKSQRGNGYLVVSVEDQTGVAWEDFTRKIRKTMGQTNKALLNINTEQLSNEGLAINNNKLAKLANMASFLDRKIITEGPPNGNGSQMPSGKQIEFSDKAARGACA
jgi:hypothetical protein